MIDDKLLPNLAGRDVLVVDDIFDTGHTLVEVIAQLAKHGPKSIRSAVLLRKTGRCEVAIQPDYVVFDIPGRVRRRLRTRLRRSLSQPAVCCGA